MAAAPLAAPYVFIIGDAIPQRATRGYPTGPAHDPPNSRLLHRADNSKCRVLQDCFPALSSRSRSPVPARTYLVETVPCATIAPRLHGTVSVISTHCQGLPAKGIRGNRHRQTRSVRGCRLEKQSGKTRDTSPQLPLRPYESSHDSASHPWLRSGYPKPCEHAGK